MVRFFKNNKLKRIIAGVLVISTLLSEFLVNTSKVSADTTGVSVDNRITSINLAKGKSILDMEEARNSLTPSDLQCVALYLSNFYKSWNTRLNIESAESDDETKDSKVYKNVKKMMVKALKSYCGFDKDTATYLVELSLKYDVATRHEMYIKKSDLECIYNFVKQSPSIAGIASFDNSLGFTGFDGVRSMVDISSLDKYIEFLGVKNQDGVDYVPLTYPIFLGAMGLSSEIATDDKVNPSGNKKDELFKDITTRYNRRQEDEIRFKSDTKENLIAKTDPKVINFYWLDEKSNKADVCFSTSNECFKMLSLISEDWDLKKGYGSAFMTMSKDDLVKFMDKKGVKDEDIVNLTAYGQRLYTNWIGDLLVDTGTDLYTVIPGSSNPYMITRIGEDDNVRGNTLQLLNINTLKHNDLLKSVSNKHHTVNDDAHAYSVSGNLGGSLYDLNYWRVNIGDSAIKWDDSYSPFSKGDSIDKIFKHISSFGFSKTPDEPDYICFPSAKWIYDCKFYGLRNKKIIDLDKEKSTNKKDINDSAYTYYLHGKSLATDTMIKYSNLSGFKENQSLSDFFLRGQILDVYKSYTGLMSSTYTAINNTEIDYDTATKEFFQPLFLTYSFAMFNKDAKEYKQEDNVVNLKLQSSHFPTVADTVIDWSGMSVDNDSMAEETLGFIYYLLHPSKGISYVATLIKNKLSGLFLGWHEDIVGSSNSNSSLGTTQYLGVSGYVTTPSLTDIGWISSLVKGYNDIIVYLVIMMIIILLAYVVVGQQTIQRAIIGLIMFTICALLPPLFINGTINVINAACDTIYSKKFEYWGIVQTEEYLKALDNYTEAIDNESDESTIMATLMSTKLETGDIENSESSYSGMKVKWISPKKFNDMAELSKSMANSGIGQSDGLLKSFVINSISATISGETYLSGDNNLYLYRDILDLYRYGAISYNIYGANGGITNSDWVSEHTDNKYNKDEPASSIVNDMWGKPSKSNNSSRFEAGSLTSSASDSILSIFDNNRGNVKKVNISNDGTFSIELSDLANRSMYNLIQANLSNSELTFTNQVSSLSALSNGFINSKFDGSVTNYYTKNNMANTLLVTYSNTFKEMGLHNIIYSELSKNKVSLDDNALTTEADWGTWCAKSIFAGFTSGFDYTLQSLQGAIDGSFNAKDDNLSHFYYSLYSESPYYFLNYEFRDVLSAKTGYTYNNKNLASHISDGKSTNNVVSLFLDDNQSYFYNYTEGDGYGELKDFMNMHDFFYYVIPSMKSGVDLVRKFGDDFGFKTYDTCPLRIQPDGSFKYNSSDIIDSSGTWIGSMSVKDFWSSLNQQERYEFWHDLNVNLLSYYYCSWLDTMYDCSYAEPETIHIAKKKFTVKDPLDPMTYFTVSPNGDIAEGRYMVFSRSEMKYYGLKLSDLTTVERKIIDLQDNVYNSAIKLTNYYNLSDETLIHSYSLLQLFEFDKIFSQKSTFGKDYQLYPQGYELKATSYDGFLRLILYGSTGEPLMSDSEDGSGNISMYERIMKKTSLFFGLLLVVNDFIAVYMIPALKLFFLIVLFFLGIAIIVASAIKLEMNIINILWKSLFSPMLLYGGISISLALLVSLFMSNGASNVTEDSVIIQLGDPTMVIFVMLLINAIVLILYWKVCKKCATDLRKFLVAIFNSVFGAFSGVISKTTGALTSGRVSHLSNNNDTDFSTPAQRGKENNPRSAKKSGVATAVGAGLVGAGVGAAVGSSGSSSLSATEQEKSDRYNNKSRVGKALNSAINDADYRSSDSYLDAVKKREDDSADSTATIKSNKFDKKIDKYESKQQKYSDKVSELNAKKNHLGKDADAKELKRLERKIKRNSKKGEKYNDDKILELYSKGDKRLDSINARKEKRIAKANKKAEKLKIKSTALKASGINRYKVGAVGKAGAKFVGKKGLNTAKRTVNWAGRTAVNTAKNTAKNTVNTAKNTARGTVNTAKRSVESTLNDILKD